MKRPYRDAVRCACGQAWKHRNATGCDACERVAYLEWNVTRRHLVALPENCTAAFDVDGTSPFYVFAWMWRGHEETYATADCYGVYVEHASSDALTVEQVVAMRAMLARAVEDHLALKHLETDFRRWVARAAWQRRAERDWRLKRRSA